MGPDHDVRAVDYPAPGVSRPTVAIMQPMRRDPISAGP
jgi:hypothetical protein